MITYTGKQRELYAEALRTVPAVTAARIRESDEDAFLLTLAYVRQGREWGIDDATVWSILSSAASSTILGLVNLVADVEEVESLDVVDRMIAVAAQQVASGAL